MRTTHAAAPPGHQPVLLTETITLLQPRPGGRYLDGTFGGGGHTRAILAGSAPDGRVLALDADPAAISRGEALRTELADPDRLRLVHANFADLARTASETGFAPLDGILLDLGLSSFQLDEADRGFAFRYEGPLDMRFDPTQGNPAADLVNELPQDALADLIYRYGEEPRSRRIAAAIVRARREAPILTTTRLAEIVSHAVGGRRGRDIHPATQTFQALRIAVNCELEALEQALAAALTVLAPGGRLVVISFHSLEDRIVKRFFQRERSGCICPPEQPVCTCGHQPRLRLLTRTVRASVAEQANNPRSRSATLRAAERLAEEPTGRGDRGSDITGARIGSAWDSSPRLSDGSRLKPTGDPAFRESATAAGRVPRKDMSFRAAAGVPLGHLSFPLATGAKDHSCEHEVRPCHQRSWVSASTRSRTASPLRNERWPRGTPAAARNDRERVRQNTDRRSWRSRGPAAPGDSSGSTLRMTEGRVQDDKSGRSNIERSGQETISVGFSRLISLSLGLESQVEQATTTHRDIKHSRAETTPNTISISARSYNGVRNYHEGSIHGRGGANR